ncbi:hypothetical protein QQZ08_008233 [Neonectria magnoliae]|uniref:Uncharacterized protein n=1 Tax=Neonectria magnoliae TaxID=2732573 RepID=A0ABR1HWC7_9HYPO
MRDATWDREANTGTNPERAQFEGNVAFREQVNGFSLDLRSATVHNTTNVFVSRRLERSEPAAVQRGQDWKRRVWRLRHGVSCWTVIKLLTIAAPLWLTWRTLGMINAAV